LDIPIVVAAYNREHSLKRILSSLSKANYSERTKLIISIDGGGPKKVKQIAKEFDWSHGKKEVVEYERNMGLRKHIISCGAMVHNYDGIVLLEDDLYVSPWFYRFAQAASAFYRGCPEISGISLYSPRYNETAYLPFCPLNDGTDTFFMQLASSWGQVWLRDQWGGFDDWYSEGDRADLIQNEMLPINVQLWPDISWKKYFIQYMISNHKYFVYPHYSYTTNFGDRGKNHDNVKRLQVPMVFGEKAEHHFLDFKDSNVIYDACSEMDADCLRRLNDTLHSYDFAVDLYGAKERQNIDKPWVITSKECSDFDLSYDKSLLPIESNVIEAIPGQELFLAKVRDVKIHQNMEKNIFLKANELNELKYHYAIDETHFYVHKQELVQPILNSNSFRVGEKIVHPFSFLKRCVKNMWESAKPNA